MRSILKRFFSILSSAAKTDFAKVSIWSSIATFVRMVSGVISTKVVAWIIGPSGVGIVGNFLNSINIISMLATGGIGQGVTKSIAENYDRPEVQKKIINHAIKLTLGSTLIISFAVLLFSGTYSRVIFKTNEYDLIVVLFGISIILYSFNLLFVYIINGFKKYRKFIRISIASSLVGLVTSVILVLSFGLYGALVSTIVSQSIIIFITIFFIYKEPWFKSMFSRVEYDSKVFGMLGGFTLMTIVSTFSLQFSQLYVRTYIGDHLSLHHAGIWESMNRISAMYLTIITTGISTYYLPRLSEIRENALLKAEIYRTMKLVLPILLVGCLLIFLTRDLIVWLLFTKEFYEVRSLFAFQMLGDFFKIASLLIAFLFWVKAWARLFIITEILFAMSYIFLCRSIIPEIGLRGSVIAYAFNYAMYFIFLVFVLQKLLKR